MGSRRENLDQMQNPDVIVIDEADVDGKGDETAEATDSDEAWGDARGGGGLNSL